jgi:hypothetical protein
MTISEIEAAKAAFLAKGGQITSAPVGVAYGIDPEADKAKRRAAREAADYDESAYERRAEAIREAYHTGGRHAAIDAMNA